MILFNQHVYRFFRWRGFVADRCGAVLRAFFMRDFARQELDDASKHHTAEAAEIRKLRIEHVADLDQGVQMISIWKKHGWLLPGEYDALMDVVEVRACGIEALSD